MAFSPDGAILATGGGRAGDYEDHSVQLWEPDTDKVLVPLGGHREHVIALAFHPREPLLAVGDGKPDRPGCVNFWNVATREIIARLQGHDGEVRALAFVAGGNLLASGGSDGQVLLWNVKPPRLLRGVGGHEGGVNAVGFVAGGALLLSASDDGFIRVWDVASGSLRRSLEGHLGAVSALAVNPDETLLVSGGADHIVRAWGIAVQPDAPAGRPTRFEDGPSRQAANGAQPSPSVGPDGNRKLAIGVPPPAVAPFDEKKAKEHQAACAEHLGVPVGTPNHN